MATEDEVVALLTALASAYTQPVDETMEMTWTATLAPYSAANVAEVVKMYMSGGGASGYFPKLPEFVNSVKELQRRDELSSIQRRRTEASFRCDGSRWRESATDKARDGSPTLEPCPTCNPVLHAELSEPAKNRMWHDGRNMERDDLLVAPKEPCAPLRSETVMEPPGIEALRASDWSQSRRDVM